MKRVVQGVGAVIAALMIVLGGAGIAQAGTGACNSGYQCFWWDLNYDGNLNGSSYTKYSVDGYQASDEATSAGANGASCSLSRYYDAGNWTGSSGTGYFTLYSQQRMGTNYRDPDLQNGAGLDGVGYNWNDRVSSMQFLSCV